MGIIHIDDYDRERNSRRFQVAYGFVLLVAILLLGRLATLQLLRGERYDRMAKAQQLRKLNISPMRGDIVDRYGNPLAKTQESFRLLLYSEPTSHNVSDLMGTVAELLGLDKADLQKKFARRKRTESFEPISLLDDLDRDDVAAIEENLTGYGGLEVEQTTMRVYPQGKTASQLLGYLGEVTAKERDPQSDMEYKPGDLVGRMGIEEQWEETLRGKYGSQQVVVDSTGKRNKLFEQELKLPAPIPPTPGATIELTIDLDLQRATEQALGENAGAAVVMDVNTGEILAIASTPGFDPNQFIKGMDTKEWVVLQEDPRRPFFNRPVQGEYPPASVFKIVVAAAALQEGVIRIEDNIRCLGVVEIGANKDKYHCWHPAGHGYVDIYRAIAESCDVYFYRIAERLGIEKIKRYAINFGMDQPPVLGLPGEKRGLFPDPLWKQRVIRKQWYLGDTVIAGIGQGYTLVTPLQALRLASVIASGGKLIKPQMVRRILTRDGKVIREFIPEIQIPQVVSPDICNIISQAMVKVVNDPMGTGFNYLGITGVSVAGKTGTAQVISRKKKEVFMETEGDIPWEYRDHSWFVAFAPAQGPKIAVSVLVEHGGSGSTAAEPICGQIIKHYMQNQYRHAGVEHGGQ